MEKEGLIQGGETEKRNIDIVNQLCKVVAEETGKPLSDYTALIRFVADRPGHDQRYAIDCTKIKRELGWSQKYKFYEGLKSTVRWYLEPKDWVESVRTGAYRKWIEANYTQLKRT